MSLHRKVTYRIVILRSALTALKATARNRSHVDALDGLIRGVDALIHQADEMLEPASAVQVAASRGAFDFGAMEQGGHFDVSPERVNSLRVAASNWGRRHGVTLTVRALPDGGARCVRVDGLTPVELARVLPPKPGGDERPVHPVTQLRKDNPPRPPVVRDELDDPQTAADVRAAMAIPEEKRTDWQQVIVEDFQHLVDFEHVAPSFEVVHQALLVDAVNRTPRQAWLVANHLHLLD